MLEEANRILSASFGPSSPLRKAVADNLAQLSEIDQKKSKYSIFKYKFKLI